VAPFLRESAYEVTLVGSFSLALPFLFFISELLSGWAECSVVLEVKSGGESCWRSAVPAAESGFIRRF